MIGRSLSIGVRRMARTAGTGLGLGLLAGSAGPARAHGTDLAAFEAPIPLALLLGGAAATVVLTAGVLAVGGTLSIEGRPLVRIPGRAVQTTRLVGRLGFSVLVVAAIGHGLVGRQVVTDNLATLVVWPVWLYGLAFVAILVGSPWQILSPWRATYEWLCRLEAGRIQVVALPPSLGVWPALVGFLLVVGVVANLTAVPRNPAATAGFVAAGWAVMVGGGVVFGTAWFRRADPLAVLYCLFGRVAPVTVERPEHDGGSVILVGRPPWVGAAHPVATRTLAAFVVAMVYTVSFDGFVETPEYQAGLVAVHSLVGPIAPVAVGFYLVGFCAFVGVFWAVARTTGALGGFDRPVVAVAPTVIPIAAAYEVAHAFPFVLGNLGQLPAALGGPAVDLIGWLSLAAFWGSQVTLIVLGHVVAVIAAHQVVFRRVESRRRALVAHLPLVALMVGYTVLSLWIISRPVVG